MSQRIAEYYKHEVETFGPDERPPHNIMRKCMYRQVAVAQGFIKREKHPYCLLGIREPGWELHGPHVCLKGKMGGLRR
jgi:hypothetical protein